MSDGKQKQEETEEIDVDDETDSEEDDFESVEIRAVPGMDSESRRKLEEALEERRLQKEIQDYDFDLD